ncbi:uridine kinase [Saccharomonospora xinjiangensis]|uniref:uridine kinase n=1 Tax=Saccharomonospora xinjiangensis TaxID=75294 RepID=UPI00351046A9
MPTSARFRPVTVERLVTELADRIAGIAAHRVRTRVLIDGADLATDAAALADALVDPLRVRGHDVLRVSAHDFLRPASLRFERGRRDPDVRYEDWLDVAGLRREVLDPLEESGTGHVLPALWDAARDRAFRLPRTSVPDGGVAVLDGELLLGQGLPAELTVHLWLSPGALRRRLPEDSRWALPAYTRYDTEVRPSEQADVVVRVDDPRRPAVRES